MVYNLLINAISYTGEDKTVIIRQLFTKEGKVRLEIKDSGKGIPADKQHEIWERYYREEGSHTRAKIGTGLGLSIVRNIIELHGFDYGVLSGEGEGSTFWFEIKLAEKS